MTRLLDLSVRAHEAALEKDTLTPAERMEWLHLPMTRVNGVPAFNSRKMREDQADDLVARLERMVSQRRPRDVADAVAGYMATYGRLGVRLRDVMDHVGATKPIVLKALRDLTEGNKVRISEEVTRGNGSKRKRYYWVEMTAVPELEDLESLGLREITAGSTRGDSGIYYHGTATQGVTCGCLGCRHAILEALVACDVSAARRRGETGLREGLAA